MLDVSSFSEDFPGEHLDPTLQIGAREWFSSRVPDPLGPCRGHGHRAAGHGWLRHLPGMVHPPGQRQRGVSAEFGTDRGGAASATHGAGAVSVLPGRARRWEIKLDNVR